MQTKHSLHFTTWPQAEAFVRHYVPGLVTNPAMRDPDDDVV